MKTGGQARGESGALRSTLVADLAHSTRPTCIMLGTLVGIAVFVHGATGRGEILAFAACGCVASAAKLVLMWRQRQQTASVPLDDTEIRRLERTHSVMTASMAASVGATSAAIFLSPDAQFHILAAGLIFGYGSGVSTRLGIRPWIAIPALFLAALPSILALVLKNDATHHILAVFLLVFLFGACESVRHIYQSAVRHVGMRLQMASLAFKDPLTGLANRTGLREAFQAIAADMPVAVLCLDLDGFKAVNDRYGHAAGDALLTMVAGRLSAIAAAEATIVRMGGDEFAILLSGLPRTEAVADLARRITESLHQPFALGTETVTIGASVGHAVSSFKPATLEALLARADAHCYRIKAARKAEVPQALLRDIA